MPPIERRAALEQQQRSAGRHPKRSSAPFWTPKPSKKGQLPAGAHNYEAVRDVVVERVERTKGKMSAKRLLPIVRAAGYEGSPRNLRRLVAEVKAEWRRDNHRGRRPGIWSPGDMLVFDWGEIGPLFVFCAVMAWSRVRFVYFADNLGAESTMTALARCFEYLGGVPKTALTDRMGCLKGGTVAGLVIPTPAYVRFATHYKFRPDFCEGADPESKGLVENLVGYSKSDLMIPEELSVADLPRANDKGLLWCNEVNAVMHSEICAVPFDRLAKEREADGDSAAAAGPDRQVGGAQGRSTQLCPLRLRPLFGAQRPHRSPGRTRRPRRPGSRRVLGRDRGGASPRCPW